MLSEVRRTLGDHGKALKALVLFGSSVRSPTRSRDVDLLVVVDRLADAREKCRLEAEVARRLRLRGLRKPVDVVVLDLEALEENAKPGGLVSGLIAGYEVLYDEVGVPTVVERILREISAEGEYVVIKGGRRLNLSSLARVRRLPGEGEAQRSPGRWNPLGQ